MSKMIQTTFDYAQPLEMPEPVKPPDQEVEARWDEGLDAESREFVQKITDEIHGQMKRTAEGVMKTRAEFERGEATLTPWPVSPLAQSGV